MKKFITAMFVTLSAWAQAQGVDGTQQLQQRVNAIQSLDADFSQVAYGGGAQKSSGNLKISKPNKFAWTYKKPSEQEIVNNNQKVYFYDKDLQQVTVYPHKDMNGDMASVILNGGQSLANNFAITLETNLLQELGGKGLANAEAYRLQPRNSKIDYSAVWLVFRNGVLDRLLLDNDKQKTALFFNNVKVNPKLNNKVFDFQPPKGVDVIEN